MSNPRIDHLATFVLIIVLTTSCNLPRAPQKTPPGQAAQATALLPQVSSPTPLLVPPTMPIQASLTPPMPSLTPTGQPQVEAPTATLAAAQPTSAATQPMVPLPSSAPALGLTQLPDMPFLPSPTATPMIVIIPKLFLPPPIPVVIPGGQSMVGVFGKVTPSTGVARYSVKVPAAGHLIISMYSENNDLRMDVVAQSSGSKLANHTPGFSSSVKADTYTVSIFNQKGSTEKYQLWVDVPMRVLYTLQKHIALSGNAQEGRADFDVVPQEGTMIAVTIQQGVPGLSVSVFDDTTGEQLMLGSFKNNSFIQYNLHAHHYVFQFESPNNEPWTYKIDFLVCKGCAGW